MSRSCPPSFLLWIIPALLMTSACLPKSKPSTVELPTGKKVEARSVRLDVYELARELRGMIEESFDGVRSASPDLEVRRAALEWKASTIPAMQRASFRPDPVEALIDLWLLVVQLGDFLESDSGTELFGNFSATLARTTDGMEQHILDFVREKGGKPEENGSPELVHRYAAEHPIRHSIASRPTVGGELSRELEKRGVGAFAAVGQLLEGFGELSDRITIYAEQLPMQVRWQAELLLFDKGLETIDIDALLADTARLGNAADYLVEFSEGLEPMIGERIEELVPEIERIVESIEVDEIVASVDDIAAKHLTVALLAVTAERQAVLEAVSKERIAALDDAERMANEIVDRSFDRVDSMVGDSLGRLMPVGLALLAGTFVLGFIGGMLLRRRPAGA